MQLTVISEADYICCHIQQKAVMSHDPSRELSPDDAIFTAVPRESWFLRKIAGSQRSIEVVIWGVVGIRALLLMYGSAWLHHSRQPRYLPAAWTRFI